MNCYLTDDYFQYESDDFPSFHHQPVLKLLTKRQTEETKISKEEKKPIIAAKPQPSSNPENSSNTKPIGSQVAVLTDENSKKDFTFIKFAVLNNISSYRKSEYY